MMRKDKVCEGADLIIRTACRHGLNQEEAAFACTSSAVLLMAECWLKGMPTNDVLSKLTDDITRACMDNVLSAMEKTRTEWESKIRAAATL